MNRNAVTDLGDKCCNASGKGRTSGGQMNRNARWPAEKGGHAEKGERGEREEKRERERERREERERERGRERT